MSRLQRHSLDWAGDMVQSPHGDWIHAGDVERLQDKAEATLKALEAAQARIAELEAAALAKPVQGPARESGAGRLFGWVNPNDARRFNSGDTAYCKVFKRRTEVFTMPLSNALGPNHYQKPPVGAVVTIYDGDAAEVKGHVPEGLTVAAGGIEFNVTKWSWNPCKN